MGGEAAEVLLLRLILVADDYARFDGRLTVIQRRCWPAGDDEPGLPAPTVEEIAARLATLATEHLVVPYEVNGKPYLYIPNFLQRTRAAKSKYPAPPGNVGQASDKGPTDVGQASGRWQTPDGRTSDTSPTRVGAPRAGSSSGISTNNNVSTGESKPQPVDKSARDVQGGLTRSTPATSKTTGIGLKPPAAMTEEERTRAGVSPPPPDLMARYLKPTREPGEDELEHVDDSHPAKPAKAPNGQPPPDWEASTTSIDHAGTTLGMKRLPFEEDPDYARRIHARLNLG